MYYLAGRYPSIHIFFFVYGSLCPLHLMDLLRVNSLQLTNNKKTPEGVYAGCVGVTKNYRYVLWQWKVE